MSGPTWLATYKSIITQMKPGIVQEVFTSFFLAAPQIEQVQWREGKFTFGYNNGMFVDDQGTIKLPEAKHDVTEDAFMADFRVADDIANKDLEARNRLIKTILSYPEIFAALSGWVHLVRRAMPELIVRSPVDGWLGNASNG